MRCNWRRWLWGVIPLVALALAAAQLERAAIEQDLTERARHALGAKGAHWAVVNFSGRDVVLTGNAIADNEPREAVAVLRSLWGVGKVKNDAGLPKLVEPYVWTAYRRGNRVRLKGYYPNRAMRQTIVGMTRASLPGLEVVDRMRAARGVPPTDTWLAGVSFALKQLASLKRGDVRLEGLALTISGEAENADAYRAVTAALKRGLPKGITLASVQIAAPVVSPFTWSAEFAGGQLALSGYVTSEGARTELLAAARVAAGTVVDRMEVAGGAPSGSAEAAAALIKEIVRLQSGSAQMKDAAVVVGGVAADNAQAQAVREGLRASLPAGFKLTDQIRVREPKVEPKAETKPAEQLAPAAPPEKKDAASAKPRCRGEEGSRFGRVAGPCGEEGHGFRCAVRACGEEGCRLGRVAGPCGEEGHGFRCAVRACGKEGRGLCRGALTCGEGQGHRAPDTAGSRAAASRRGEIRSAALLRAGNGASRTGGEIRSRDGGGTKGRARPAGEGRAGTAPEG